MMKYSYLLLLFAFVMGSCGSENDGPLQNYEIEEIEDELIKAMQKGKLKMYADKSLEHQMTFEDIEALIPKDSAGRYDLSGFGVLTEEESALNRGDFSNNSTELAALSIYSLFISNGVKQYLPICLLDWNEVSKKLNANYRRRFNEYLLGYFHTDIDKYKAEINQLKLEVVNEKLFGLLQDGTITAYENDNLSSVKSPGELKSYLARKQDQIIEDPEDSLGTIMQRVEVPVSAQDISFYKAAYDEDENVIALTMMTHEFFQGITINTPWVALDFVEVKENLDEAMLGFLNEHLLEQEQDEEELVLDTLETPN